MQNIDHLVTKNEFMKLAGFLGRSFLSFCQAVIVNDGTYKYTSSFLLHSSNNLEYLS